MQRDVALSLAVKLIARHVRAVDVKHGSKQKGGECRGERREVPKLGFSAVRKVAEAAGQISAAFGRMHSIPHAYLCQPTGLCLLLNCAAEPGERLDRNPLWTAIRRIWCTMRCTGVVR